MAPTTFHCQMADQVDRTSKLPLYHQLYEILRGSILKGEWQPGDMIPPESELIERYHISRTTVRQVLDKLVNEGLIFRQRGRGTFVAHPTVDQGLSRIISFTEDMRRRGFRPGTQVLAAQIVSASADIAAELQVTEGEELALLRRLRLADEEPMSIEESHLVHRYCRGVLQYDYAQRPLRDTLEHDYGIRLTRARQVIRAVAAPGPLAKLLAVPARSPLLYIERVSFSQQDMPIEFLCFYHRGDRYTLHNELQG
jgi:DNA-binding GntR family transcriptional regulator